ncbi:MAG TPA: TIGR03435 family protein [Bryobacteraceae bacterium]|nr:TIGR03435 family protein [Bryobacteraceae bacterium]
MNREQIIGVSGWMETEGWDIDARFPAGSSPAQAPQMMQAMLADRFRLVTHRETRTMPVYALTVAKSGLKLHEGSSSRGMSAGQRLIRYGAGTMDELASQLSGYLGRHVTDRTGLTGRYAIDLSFAPVDLSARAADAAQDLGPSIFQALQEQAGLKLESTKGPVEVLVIDHAEKPTPD